MKLRYSLLSTALLSILSLPLHAVQGYYRSPVLQQDQLVFTAEGDLWHATLTEVNARRITSHLAEESQPLLSADGTQLAFVANYDGASEIYLMPLSGGVAKRVSFENSRVRIQQWLADGRILYATDSAAGPANYWLLKTLNPQTLQTETLPLADASASSPPPQAVNTGPNTTAPNGRTAKPAAKASSAKMKPVVSLTPLKNCAAMIAASDPYR